MVDGLRDGDEAEAHAEAQEAAHTRHEVDLGYRLKYTKLGILNRL